MKKHILPSLAIAMIAIAGCSKSKSNPMAYIINGLVDVNVRQYDDTTIIMPIGAEYSSGPQEAVTITPQNLPAGVTVTPASISGTPGFTGAFTFKVYSTASGTLPVSFKATSATSGNKSLAFNINVTPNSDCSDPYSGSWHCVDTTAAGVSNTYSTTVSVDSVNRIMIRFRDNFVLANINCVNNAITTPAFRDYFTGADISAGSGTITRNYIILHYTVSNPSPVAYTTVYTR
jgi:hypothetical protein